MHDIAKVFMPQGYFAPTEGVDRREFSSAQEEEIELGLFRMIFWGGEKPEDIRISSHVFKGVDILYFVVRGERFLPPNEERESV